MKILLASVLVLLLSPSALLAQLYSLEAYTCGSGTETRANSGDPVHWGGIFHDCDNPESWVELDGYAGRGDLRTMAYAFDAHEGDSYPSDEIAGIYAIMRFSDVVVEGPTSTVQVALNLNIHAFVSASSATGLSFGAVWVDVYLESHAAGGVAQFDAGHNAQGLYDVGLLDGLLEAAPGGAQVDAMITSPLFEVPTNSELFLRVVLSSVTGAHDPHLTAEGFSNAGNTLSFPRDTPVFDLPVGYTVNSAQAGIVDNAWTPDVRNDETSWGVLKSRY